MLSLSSPGITSNEQFLLQMGSLPFNDLANGKIQSGVDAAHQKLRQQQLRLKDISPQLLNLFPLPHLRQRTLQFRRFLVDHGSLFSGLFQNETALSRSPVSCPYTAAPYPLRHPHRKRTASLA